MPRYEITSPDGKRFEITAPDGATQEQVLAYAQGQFKAAPAKPNHLAPLNYNPHAAAAETALALGSGAVAAPLAGLAGLAQTAKNLVSPGMPAGERVRQIQGALTYSPQTIGGKALSGAVAAPFELLAEGADIAGGAATDATGSPAVGAGVNTLAQAVPALLTRAGARPVTNAVNARAARIQAEQAAERSRQSVRDKTLLRAQAEGLKIPPSVINPTAVNKVLESVGGKAAINQELQRRNQPVIDRIARDEASLAPDQPITRDTLRQAASDSAQPYREVAALPPIPSTNPLAGQFNLPRYAFNPADDLQALRQARKDAQGHWFHYKRTGDPEAQKKAEAAHAEAERLDAALETAAQQAGRPELIPMLRAARQQIAKIHDVGRATNVGGGNVDARIIGHALDRGQPLTGGLETIGRFAEGIGAPYVRDINMVPSPGVSALEPMASAGFALGGHAAAGPAGFLAAGIPLLRGPARSLVLSDFYQNRMAQPQYANPITLPPGQTTTLAALLAAIQAQQE